MCTLARNQPFRINKKKPCPGLGPVRFVRPFWTVQCHFHGLKKIKKDEKYILSLDPGNPSLPFPPLHWNTYRLAVKQAQGKALQGIKEHLEKAMAAARSAATKAGDGEASLQRTEARMRMHLDEASQSQVRCGKVW